MSLSPAPFLRIGFVILGLGLALGIWTGSTAALGWLALPAGGLGFLIVTGVGEALYRRIAPPAEIRADLEDRVRHSD